MSARWVRVPAEPRDTAAAGILAGALGVGVGLVSFYLLRTLLAREPLEGDGDPSSRDKGGDREGGGA